MTALRRCAETMRVSNQESDFIHCRVLHTKQPHLIPTLKRSRLHYCNRTLLPPYTQLVELLLSLNVYEVVYSKNIHGTKVKKSILKDFSFVSAHVQYPNTQKK